MSTIIEHRFWNKFIEKGEILKSEIPKIVLNSSEFKAFFNGDQNGAIISEKSGRGSVLRINESKRIIVEKFFQAKFPEAMELIEKKFQSVATFRNSKTKRTKEQPIFFLKGFQKIKLNEEFYDIADTTLRFGLAAFINPAIEYDRICFVENKDVFLEVENLIGRDYLYIHKYGRISSTDIAKLKTSEILVFSDYDYVGLNEYLKIKSQFENTKLFLPDNYDRLYETYSTRIPEKQIAPSRVLESNDPIVRMIVNQIQRQNQFLEQQAVIINTK